MKKRTLLLIIAAGFIIPTSILFVHCPPGPGPGADSAPVNSADTSSAGTTVTVLNSTGAATLVTVSFGSNSVVLPSSWPFCTPLDTGASACSFSLGPQQTQPLPLGGQYFNATLAFGAPSVGCGTTKAEFNVNNSSWYDIVDLSLVDGYSNKVSITVQNLVGDAGGDASPILLGPPVGEMGNDKVYGLFPLGCDICVARQTPSCGREAGTFGCKTGTQYNPDVPCQYQGPFMGGGSAIQVSLLGP